MAAYLRLFIRTGLIACGILFGPDMVFAVLFVSIRLSRTNTWNQALIVLPLLLAMVSCALWALIAGHRYVRAWFLVVAVVWNLWAMLDIFKRAQSSWELTFAIPWLVWTVWFSYRLVEYGERRKALTGS